MLDQYQARIAAPFAVLGVRTAGDCLTGIEYLPRGAATLAPVSAFAREVCRQLEAYLDDPDFVLDLPFRQPGTAFQRKVWGAVRGIPRGEVRSYGELAGGIGSAPRAVGAACGANRIPLLIPCHRVVASRGLGGFMHSRSGRPLEIKRWLLSHERVVRAAD